MAGWQAGIDRRTADETECRTTDYAASVGRVRVHTYSLPPSQVDAAVYGVHEDGASYAHPVWAKGAQPGLAPAKIAGE